MSALRVGLALVLLLSVTACSAAPEDAVLMPDVVGLRLDVALSDIERAGFSDDVEVLGGGVFGVVDESNWQVCEQVPAAGQGLTAPPRITVDRSCGNSAPGRSEAPAEDDSSAGRAPADRETNWSGDQIEFRFGETASFTATAGSPPDVPLTFTVSPPVAFTPSDPAESTQATTVYFTVTIENGSDTETWDPDFLFPKAISGETDGDPIHDGEINGTYDLPPEIGPGESVTFKDGWSIESIDDVRYELDIDGLAGYTIYFTG